MYCQIEDIILTYEKKVFLFYKSKDAKNRAEDDELQMGILSTNNNNNNNNNNNTSPNKKGKNNTNKAKREEQLVDRTTREDSEVERILKILANQLKQYYDEKRTLDEERILLREVDRSIYSIHLLHTAPF